LLEARPAEVIVSDMRMPGMDGAAFLKASRAVAPHAVRVLLTGESDVSAAIAAVNEGQIFRFLEKPCPPALLTSVVEAAAAQHRMASAEKVLLEQTLRGSIKALTDVLALAQPAAFGRSSRIRQKVTRLVQHLAMQDCWQVDIAAMVCQLGTVALPAATAAKVYYGHTLTAAESAMVERMPEVTAQLLANIPRLEMVLAILAAQNKAFRELSADATPDERLVARGAEVLKIATDFERLEAGGLTTPQVIAQMRAHATRYEPAVLEAFVALHPTRASIEGRALPLSSLEVGMTFAEDLKTSEGLLLAARGYRVTSGFVERVRNAGAEIAHLIVHVIDAAPDPEAS